MRFRSIIEDLTPEELAEREPWIASMRRVLHPETEAAISAIRGRRDRQALRSRILCAVLARDRNGTIRVGPE